MNPVTSGGASGGVAGVSLVAIAGARSRCGIATAIGLAGSAVATAATSSEASGAATRIPRLSAFVPALNLFWGRHGLTITLLSKAVPAAAPRV